AEARKAGRGAAQLEDALDDSSLAVLGGRSSHAEAQPEALGEGRRRPQRKQQAEYRSAQFHFTPSSIIRLASGKKKIVIKMRQAMTEHIVSHFMRETSYFKCIKNPMISAALISDKPIRMVNILSGSMF